MNRQILDAFEAEGIAIALPTFTTRVEPSSFKESLDKTVESLTE